MVSVIFLLTRIRVETTLPAGNWHLVPQYKSCTTYHRFADQPDTLDQNNGSLYQLYP